MATVSASSTDISPLMQQAIDLITTMGNDYRAIRAVCIASLAILIYDYALTLGQEIAYLRSGKWGLNQTLYTIIRYWPMVDVLFDNIALALVQPPDAFCTFFFNWAIYAAVPIHITIGVILILRIHAMYNCNRTLLWALSALLFAQVVAQLVVTGPLVAHMTPFKLPPPFSGCVPENPSPHLWAYWVPFLCFESVIFALAIVKVCEEARKEWRTPKVLVVLLRDSLAYFGGVFAIILANVLMWSIARPSLLAVTIAPSVAIHSILGCRMLLNIYEAVQPTYAGHASIFAATFRTTEPRIFPQRQRQQRHRGSDDGHLSFATANLYDEA